MSDKEQRNASQYKYEEMANKVTRADRRLFDDPASRKDRNISSNPESLANKISVKDMGTRAHASELSGEERHSASKEVLVDTVHKSRKPKSSTRLPQRNVTDFESLNYIPRTPENQLMYDLLLAWCSSAMDNDLSQDIVKSLADIVLEILKKEDVTDNQRKSNIEEALEHPISVDQFQEVLSLSKRITDYGTDQDDLSEADERGIAVVFDDEEDEDDEVDDDDPAEEASEAEIEPESNDENEKIEEDEQLITIGESSYRKNEEVRDNLAIQSIDPYFLRRLIAAELKSTDSVKNTQRAEAVFELLKKTIEEKSDLRFLENELVEFFDFEHSELVEKIINYHKKIYFGILLSSATTDEAKLEIFNQMRRLGHQVLVDEYILGADQDRPLKRKLDSDPSASAKKQKADQERRPRRVDLDSLVFDEGSHLRTSTTFKLPKGAYKLPKKYEEIHIPAPETPQFDKGERLIPISELPEWVQPVFPSSETSTLNRIQSKVYPSAFNSDENILMCAPTGAGKTNVAMLTVLRTLSQFRNEVTSEFDLDAFKIVYIAPLKALVQEQVREFQRRLSGFGISVSELTGDSNLTKAQISSTQILVTTPEKWDVITRKMSDVSYVNLVRLVIIDEIHLLHDERGPVLESIVSRTLRSIDVDDNEPVRLIGLSATLPNYKDVATFMRVHEDKGLFYFDSSYRPCPLAQQFIGVSEKKALKKYQAMNEVCYDKILESVTEGHQVIVFVHSRKETFKTAKWVRDKLLENGELQKVVKSDSGSIEVLREESERCKDSGLKDLLPTGFAIHHAGLSREDRSKSEDLFAEGYVQVLISTATLAWGVNLPAHTVIIKGTNVYSPEKGTWVELSPQDILQMLGRAGRPRYDKSGEGIIITSQDEIQYYLAILNQQLPIESQLMSKLIDNINAEVVLGTVKSLSDAVNWLAYTYLYVRMLRSPSLYHVGPEYEGDNHLQFKRSDLAHSALTILNKNSLVTYNPETGEVVSTELGRIASHYYINYESMNLYNSQLRSYSSPLEILRIFAQSGEFKYIPVREEEKVEVDKLLENAPIPVKESSDDPLAKINVLLQSYISRLRLEGFALMSDMIYITQSAGRLIRALHEIALKKGWSMTAKLTLEFCKMIEKRMWLPSSPFRQFPNVPSEIVRKTESSQMPWSHYFNLTNAAEMSQAIRSERYGRTAFELLQKFPKLLINTNCQPITSTLLRVEIEIEPQWVWDTEVHGLAESFILLVEDCDGEKVLYTDTFLVRKNYVNEEHLVEFTVPMLEPKQPNYFVSLISEKWLHCEAKVPLLLNRIKVPKKFPAPTQLIHLQPTPVIDLNQKEFEECFDFTEFNRFQSQAFQSLYNSNDNVFFGAAKGTGKTTCAEIAILNHWRQSKGRAVYVSPSQDNIDMLLKCWSRRFSEIGGGKEINKLLGDVSQDFAILEKSHLTLATPQQLEVISRRWKARKSVQDIQLLIADDCHAIGNGIEGCTYEAVIARMRFASIQLENNLRIVALATALANGKDFAEWIGVTKNNLFNFDVKERVNSLEIHLQSFSIHHNPSLIMAMTKPAYNFAKESLDDDGTTVVFVPSRKHCVEIGADFVRRANNEEVDFLKADLSSIESYLKRVKDQKLREALANGIGFYYKHMSPSDRAVVERLYASGALTILLAARETCFYCPKATRVTVLSTQFYEGKEHRYIDYPINELLEMIGVANNEGKPAMVSILTNNTKREYYKKFINESLPLESHLNIYLHDIAIKEIATRVITSRQSCVDWLTYTYFYRRLQLNPSFYGVTDTSNIGLSEYLSDLVENTLNELSEAKLVTVKEDEDKGSDEEEEEEEEEEDNDDDEVSPLNGALISAHYNVSFVTMQTFAASLTAKTKLKGLMEILTASAEFEDIPIRSHENSILVKIYNRVPIKSSNVDYNSPHFKAFILLQTHFSRMSLPQDLESDRISMLEKILNLLYASIDVLSTEGYLNAVNAMDLSQMIVQAVWDHDSPLKQIPFFDEDIIKRCAKLNAETVYDIMSLEDDERDQALNLDVTKMNQVAAFVNAYPNVDISYNLDLAEPMIANEEKRITIDISRDEDVEDLTVVAPYYPAKKSESWWIAIGETSSRQLFAIKKIAIAKESQSVNMNFTIPNAGSHSVSIWCICDSYVDADKEVSFEVEVLEDDAIDGEE